MTLEKIVELFGNSKGCHLVSRRVKINKEGPFKGIKTYRIELWDVDKHCIVDTIDKTCHMTSENESTIIELLEQELVERMFNYDFK